MTTELETAIAATDAAWELWKRTGDVAHLALHAERFRQENQIRLGEFAALIQRIEDDVAAMKGGAK